MWTLHSAVMLLIRKSLIRHFGGYRDDRKEMLTPSRLQALSRKWIKGSGCWEEGAESLGEQRPRLGKEPVSPAPLACTAG